MLCNFCLVLVQLQHIGTVLHCEHKLVTLYHLPLYHSPTPALQQKISNLTAIVGIFCRQGIEGQDSVQKATQYEADAFHLEPCIDQFRGSCCLFQGCHVDKASWWLTLIPLPYTSLPGTAFTSMYTIGKLQGMKWRQS